MSAKQIIIFGATGSHNVGDDLLGLVLRRMIQKAVPQANVIIRSQHIREEIETSDLMVIGGGGLIYDATPENVTNYTSLIHRAHDLAMPVFMAGMGVQYMVTEEGKATYREALPFVEAISVRNDTDGDYLINELGCRKDQVIYARDLAFLTPEVVDLPKVERGGSGKPRLVVSLADLLVDLQLDKKGFDAVEKDFRKQKATYMKYVEDRIASLTAKYTVQLVSQAQEDMGLYERIRAKHPEIELLTFTDIDDSTRLIQVFQQADVAITGRYHGMIAGIVAQTPTILVSFGGHKIKKLIDDSFPSLAGQFYSMQEMVDADIFAQLLDDAYVRSLKQPTYSERQRCIRKAHENYRLVKMIAGACAKM